MLRALGFLLVVAGACGLDAALKAWAEVALVDDAVPLGPVALKLAYNPGVAFGLGAASASWLVLGGTGLLTAGLLVVGWRAASQSTGTALALGAIGGGALGNLIDRGGDGLVTDYISSGWWPTFNVADVLIVVGGVVLILQQMRIMRSSGRSVA